MIAGHTHAAWCPTQSDDGHSVCRLVLGAAGGVTVALGRVEDTPSVAVFTTRKAVLASLNVEQLHGLDALLHTALDTLTRHPQA